MKQKLQKIKGISSQGGEMEPNFLFGCLAALPRGTKKFFVSASFGQNKNKFSLRPSFVEIKKMVEKELSCSAHDIDHITRVYNLSLRLAKGENVDLDVLKASALLHDIARIKEDNDSTGKTDHAILGSKMAMPILSKLGFSDEKIKHIQNCIISHRYKTGNEPKTKEAQILFDADKLDALGAIGIARSFVWIGRNNAKIYTDENIEEYIKKNLDGKINGRIQDKTKHSPQIEFETKIKFLITKLHTKKAKEYAKQRMRFYKSFLNRLEKEVRGVL
jgi:uncharacterized protein